MTDAQPLTLLHTSDLHLGSDVLPEDKLKGFDQVILLARSERVHALLISGDLFDSYTVSDDDVSYAFKALGSLSLPVIFLPGNHDINLLKSKLDLNQFGSNLYLIQDPIGELINIPEIGLSIWGRPVYDHDPTFRPLEGLKPRPDKGWYVVMAHGICTGPTSGSATHYAYGRSSPISQIELDQADCDYIALGHVHFTRKESGIGTPAYYSGAPSGIPEPGILLVSMDSVGGTNVAKYKFNSLLNNNPEKI